MRKWGLLERKPKTSPHAELDTLVGRTVVDYFVIEGPPMTITLVLDNGHTFTFEATS